jgi:hypothetical protein
VNIDEEELQNHHLILKLIKKDLNFVKENEEEVTDKEDNE